MQNPVDDHAKKSPRPDGSGSCNGDGGENSDRSMKGQKIRVPKETCHQCQERNPYLGSWKHLTVRRAPGHRPQREE